MTDAMLNLDQNDPLLRCCAPRECNNATNGGSDATGRATAPQRTGLKALAQLALTRNSTRNSDATILENEPKTAQQIPVSDDPVVARPEHIRKRLVAIAETNFVDIAIIARLPKADVLECDGLPAETLIAYVLALAESADREQGRRPNDETAPALCRHCGPVWIAPEIAAMSPTLDNWPRLLGCPWCRVKARRTIARPAVTCGACSHFSRNALNPGQGLGDCTAGADPDRPFPNARQRCGSFNPFAGDANGAA